MSKDCRVGHELWTNDDINPFPPNAIKDRNGEVVLSLCRKCGRGEAELEEPCISLVHSTPDGDKLIAYMARVSNPKAAPDDPADKLIAYLLRNHHWSPFEMASMAIEVNTTRDITAQILRHKSAAFQEFSTRYADVEELETYRECRFQDVKNRQNSFTADQISEGNGIDFEADERTEDTVRWWATTVSDMARRAESDYKDARERGIAKEVARAILPMGLCPSKIYIHGTVRTWIHYCMERTKPGVQKEHREIAEAAENLLARAFPSVYRALCDVRLEEELRDYRAKQMAKIEEAMVKSERGLIILSFMGGGIGIATDPDREVWEQL